jgi:predicted neutral ceramidase superfamily lipid hydrolase
VHLSQGSWQLSSQEFFQRSLQSNPENSEGKCLAKRWAALLEFLKGEIFTLRKNSLAYFTVMMWNVLFIPLHMCFVEISFKKTLIFIILEAISSLFLSLRALKVYQNYESKKKHQILTNLDEEIYSVDP